MKVGYILLHFPCFTETFIAEEISALQKLGVDIDIVSLLGPGPGVMQPLSQRLLGSTWYAPRFGNLGLWSAQLHYLCRSPLIYLQLWLRLLRQPYPPRPLRPFIRRLAIFLKAVASARRLERQGLQALHAHFAWLSGAAAWVIARLIHLPFTVTVHAYDLYVLNDLLPLVCGEARHVITISEYNRQKIEKLKACPVENISVIHCGINLSQFQRTPSDPIAHPASDPVKILSVGSLIPKKGHVFLVYACHELKRRRINFACTIIGCGPQESTLREQIETFNLQEQVRLRGPLASPQVIAEYRKHDIFVLASVPAPDGDMDGIPVVLMEAGAMQLPLVSTRISGIPELVRSEFSGLLVPPADPLALADALSILAGDPTLRAQLGRNARALVERGYEIDQNARRLRMLFLDSVPVSTK